MRFLTSSNQYLNPLTNTYKSEVVARDSHDGHEVP